MCRMVGLSDTVPYFMAGSNVVRCQLTALCVLLPTGREASSHQRSWKPSMISNLCNCFTFLTFCHVCCSVSGSAVAAQPFLYRQPCFPVSTLLNDKAMLTKSVLCQGFSNVLISNHGQIVYCRFRAR